MSYIYDRKPSNIYFISGIWFDYSNKVSHYAVHEFLDPGVGGRSKMTKKEVAAMIEEGKEFYVFGWDYKKGQFVRGKKIYYTKGFLHHEPQEAHSRDMKHLIKISWFEVY